MKSGIIIACSMILIACSTPEDGKEIRIMDQVERIVRLPTGARPIDQYARFYTYGEDGEVVAVYLLPSSDIPQSAQCEEITDEMHSQAASCPSVPGPTGSVAAGERRWVNDRHKLPLVTDGGCSVVNVRFNPATQKVNDVYCNGVS